MKSQLPFDCRLLALKPVIFVAESYHDIRAVYSLRGNLQKASDFFQKSLEICTKTLGNSHYKVGDTLHSLGKLSESIGKPVDATNSYQEAHDIQRCRLGPHHTKTKESMDALARLKKAKPCEPVPSASKSTGVCSI